MNGVSILDGDLASKIQNLLSDPDSFKKISAIANGLSQGAPESAASPGGSSEPAAPKEAPVQNLLPSAVTAGRDPHVALLYSLKPLLSKEKQGKVDDIARTLAVVSLLKNLKK